MPTYHLVVTNFGVCDISRLVVTTLALAALALAVFGAIECIPSFLKK